MSDKKDKKAGEGSKKKKDSEKKLKDEIKKMEAKKREESLKKAAPKKKEDKEVGFDQWHASRVSAIPAVHRKEILRADFKGRGLDGKATIAKWDEALEKYGVKLKK